MIIASRTPKNERTINKTPSSKTAVRANHGEHPIWPQTVYVKNALSPIPEARATGIFAKKAIIRVATAAEIAVAVKTPSKLISEIEPSIPGLTARM